MESINKQFDFTIDGCAASLIVNDGFINSSGASPGNLHGHPFYEIHIIINGENQVRYSGGVLSGNAGDIFIVPPGLSHCFWPVANIGEHKRAAFWINVSSIDAERSGNFVFDRIHGLSTITRITDTFDAMHAVEEIQRELIEQKPCYEETLIHIFSKLMIQMCRSIEAEDSQSNRTGKTHQSLMLLIEEYIIKNYKGDCSIEGLSRYVHISRRQLTRLIGSLFSKSFRRMLLEARMSMANWLIEDQDLSFETVASEVGYSSLPAFYHAYAEFYGITPGEYQKQTGPEKVKKNKKRKQKMGNTDYNKIKEDPAKEQNESKHPFQLHG